jgi:pyridoxal/pyridoxine/pyridoxamine kinase
VLQRLGIDVWAVHTVQFSNQDEFVTPKHEVPLRALD